jgi:protease I
MSITGKCIALFAEDQYQDLELWYPYYRLVEEGAKVSIIGSGTAQTYKGKYGYPVKVDASIKDVSSKDFDAVVIPGGFAPDYMRREPKMVSFVKEMSEMGKVVAAICHGAWMLASAEIVKDRKLTCFAGIKDDLIHAGAAYVDEECVVDGKLITSRKPEDLPAFCRAIIKALS